MFLQKEQESQLIQLRIITYSYVARLPWLISISSEAPFMLRSHKDIVLQSRQELKIKFCSAIFGDLV